VRVDAIDGGDVALSSAGAECVDQTGDDADRWISSQENRRVLKGAQARLGFRVGQMIRGYGRPVEDPRREIAELYKAGGLAVVEDASREASGPPPWLGVPPELLVYRERGHRRLAALDLPVFAAQFLGNR
jgi:hypothetical protein